MNLMTVPLTSEGAKLDGIVVPLERRTLDKAARRGPVRGHVRHPARVAGAGPSSEQGMDMTVELVEELGADALMHGSCPHRRRAASGSWSASTAARRPPWARP